MTEPIVLDIEATGPHPWLHNLVAVGIGETVHRPEPGLAAARELLASDAIIVAHTNYDLRWLLLAGCELGPETRYHDTKVMAFALDKDQELSLDKLQQKYLGTPPMRKPIKVREGRVLYDLGQAVLEEHRTEKQVLVPIEDVPWPEMVAYNGQDLGQTLDLYHELKRLLEASGDWERFFLAEDAPFSRLLVEMEQVGMPIEIAEIREFHKLAIEERAALAEELVAETGAYEFNLKSGDQVAAFLYNELCNFKVKAEFPLLAQIKDKGRREKLARALLPESVKIDRVGTKFAYGRQTVEGRGLRPPKMKKKGGKMPARPSISAEQLMLLHSEDPWVQRYLRWASLNMTITNYLETWEREEHNGRLHGRFDSARAVTGRIASRDPNLMAIPAQVDFNARELFGGINMMLGDYAGLDARVAAHFSQDPLMVEIFRDNRDLYGTLAANAWGGPPDKSNPNRPLMKVLMLSMQYGAQAGSIGDKIRIAGLGEDKAQNAGKLLRDLEETLATMFAWREGIEAEARANGYIETITGRKRYLPDLYSEEWWKRAAAERMCVASMVQGTSADIVRRAMIIAREQVPHEEARILLQVHDEVLWEHGPAWTDETYEKLVSIMQDSFETDYVTKDGHVLKGHPLNVPMKFDAKPLVTAWAEKGQLGAASYRMVGRKGQEVSLVEAV